MGEITVTTNSELSLQALGEVFFKSGYFADVKAMHQAMVKILAGRELGIGPVQSMTDIYLVKGRITLSASLMASLVKKKGYRYIVTEHTDQLCTIEFFDRRDPVTGAPSDLKLGTSTFSMQDAKKAGIADGENWKKWPRNMLFARAMSNGCRWYCGDALGGSVYTVEEAQEIDDAPVESPIPVTEPNYDSQSVVEADTSPPADSAQLKRLGILAAELGWDNETRHAEAGVESFTELTRSQARSLESLWTRLLNLKRKQEARGQGTGEDPETEEARDDGAMQSRS